MTVSNAHRLTALLALALTLALAACRQESAPPGDAAEPQPVASADSAPAAAEPEAGTIPGTDATEAIDNGPLDPAAQMVGGVHVRDFAGTFSTEGARIEFKGDGTYAMTVHAASADADLASSGSWSAEAGGNEILLDPDDKSEPDRRYTVVSKDEIRQVDGGQTLRREGAQ